MIDEKEQPYELWILKGFKFGATWHVRAVRDGKTDNMQSDTSFEKAAEKTKQWLRDNKGAQG